MTDDTIEQRKKQIYSSLIKNKSIIVYFILILLLFSGFYMRTRNLPQLVDMTTGLHMPMEPDSFAFLRYSRYIIEHGEMMQFDPLRYYPTGYYPASEFSFLSHFIVWLYKTLHFFNANITLEFTDVVYPALAFVVGLVFFFLLIKRLFSDNRIALLATAFLVVTPPYLYRTMVGFADKESLGMIFFFLALYLFVVAVQSTSFKKGLAFSFLSGFITSLMGLAWGGFQFLFLIIGLFTLYEVIFDRFDKKEFSFFVTWFLVTILFSTTLFSTRFTLLSFFISETALPMGLAFLVGSSKYLIQAYNPWNLKHLLGKHFPSGITISFFSTILITLLYSIFGGFSDLSARFNGIITGLISPYSASRWGRTVAESNQPYIRDWVSQFTPLYFWLFVAGLVVFVYYAFPILLKYRLVVTGFFTLFLAAFLTSRYSSAPPFDGISPLARLLYLGGLLFLALFFLIFYLYMYKKHPDIYSQLQKIPREYIFLFIWALVMLVTARIAIRILFVFAPVTAMFAAFLFVKTYDIIFLIRHTLLRALGVVILLFFLLSPTVQGSLTSLYKSDFDTVRYSGTSYHQQWQVAMKWVRENTPKDSVFAHWWDYGYYVQTGGERATISDGGNNGGPALNYFTGRNVLTGHNSTEALSFLKAKGATHLLIVSDEIGKYAAFSSIGSNLTYDRYSSVPAFVLSPDQTVEQRNQTLFFYKGAAAIEENFLYQGKLFPAQNSGVIGIILPVEIQGKQVSVRQPSAALYYNGQQTIVPLKCVFVDREIIYDGPGLQGCFQVIPVIQGDQVNLLGAGLYLNEKVWPTLFTHLYLFNQNWNGFKLAYTDFSSIPLSLYQNRLIGPIKIWEISYPATMVSDPYYEMLNLPDPRLGLV